jgi:hypothetical protein
MKTASTRSAPPPQQSRSNQHNGKVFDDERFMELQLLLPLPDRIEYEVSVLKSRLHKLLNAEFQGHHTLAAISVAKFFCRRSQFETLKSNLGWYLRNRKRIDVELNGFRLFAASNTLCVHIEDKQKLVNAIQKELYHLTRITQGIEIYSVIQSAPHITLATQLRNEQLILVEQLFSRFDYRRVYKCDRVRLMIKRPSDKNWRDREDFIFGESNLAEAPVLTTNSAARENQIAS